MDTSNWVIPEFSWLDVTVVHKDTLSIKDKQIAEYQELAKLIVAGKFIHFTDRLAIITLAKKLLEGD